MMVAWSAAGDGVVGDGVDDDAVSDGAIADRFTPSRRMFLGITIDSLPWIPISSSIGLFFAFVILLIGCGFMTKFLKVNTEYYTILSHLPAMMLIS